MKPKMTMAHPEVGYAADCERTADDPAIPDLGPVCIEGMRLYPATDFGVTDDEIEHEQTGERRHFVSIYCAGGDVGFFHAVTPEGARQIAAGLLRAADAAQGKGGRA